MALSFIGNPLPKSQKNKAIPTASTPLSCYLRALSSSHISIKTFMALAAPWRLFSCKKLILSNPKLELVARGAFEEVRKALFSRVFR